MTPRYVPYCDRVIKDIKRSRRRRLRALLWNWGYALGVAALVSAIICGVYGIAAGSLAIEEVALIIGAAGYTLCRMLE